MSFPTLLISMAIAVAAGLPTTVQAAEPGLQISPCMGGPVEMATAPNGAIANKRILDGIEKVAWLKPTIEEPVEGIWVFGGYGLAPIAIIDTEDGLIASGDIRVTVGDTAEAARVIGLFDRYDPGRAVVVPPTTLIQNHM